LALAVGLFGCTGNLAAAERGGWPGATYFTVIARAGDTVGTIADRYRVTSSRVIEINGLKTTGPLTAGRVVLVPAITRTTREAVLSEAKDRSAPNYATRPVSLVVAHPAASATEAVKPMTSLGPHAATGILVVHWGERKLVRFAWPIAGPVISPFGPGAHGTRNEGINIAAERGAPFRAAADGTVSYAGPFPGYGNLILITHSHSYVTTYAHADNIAVARGEFVEKGHVIGTAGITGGVDRPQLHFEIRRGVTPIDPNLLLAASS